MKRTLLGRMISYSVAKYKKYEEKKILAVIPDAISNNVSIQYPYIIDHSERIRIGRNTTILSGSRIQSFPELTEGRGELVIGEHCYIGYRFCALVGEKIRIGNDVLIASDVTIVSHNHGMMPELEVSFMDQKLMVSEISIGDNCWIGDKVIVLAGVHIGHDCIIGGGSVVTKDIPPLSVAVGNPARVIKRYDMENHEWKKV